MVRFSSPEGFPPHPRHISNDIESLEIKGLIGELALNDPELYSDAQKIAASANAILALESLGILRKCETEDA